MRFDLVDLNLFAAVAEARSITRGAMRVHLSTASASERIKKLEQAFGVALFRRVRRGVEPTPAGDGLEVHARLVLQNVAIMQGEMTKYARGLKASVRLLANTAAYSEHLPKALAAFLAANPNIGVDVEERESADIAQALASGTAELGIAIDSALPAGMARHPFCDDRLVVVMGLADEFAARREVSFATIAGRSFVGLAPSSALQNHVAEQAARLGIRLKMRARLKDFDTVCQMVEAGVGLAIVPEAAARRCRKYLKIRIVRLSDRWALRRLVICASSFSALPLPSRRLVDHLRRAAA